jgi:hypothetical protein
VYGYALDMNRAKRAADRIRTTLPMLDVLADYGYRVRADGGDREQSFSCDLHGDGRDSRPSAIYYPRTNSFHCFACSRSRDAVTLVMEKEGLKFWPAIRKLEQQYRLPPLPWEDDEEPDEPTPERQITSVLDDQGKMDWAQACRRVQAFLTGMGEERTCDPLQLVRWWEAFDKVRFLHEEDKIKDSDGVNLILRILHTAKQGGGEPTAHG